MLQSRILQIIEELLRQDLSFSPPNRSCCFICIIFFNGLICARQKFTIRNIEMFPITNQIIKKLIQQLKQNFLLVNEKANKSSQIIMIEKKKLVSISCHVFSFCCLIRPLILSSSSCLGICHVILYNSHILNLKLQHIKNKRLYPARLQLYISTAQTRQTHGNTELQWQISDGIAP